MATPLIGSLFEYEITRPIEEVVKVAQADVEVVREEIREYVLTDAIQKGYELVLQRINDSITDPTEAMGVWISGFFGAGKSSFAKILGYVLEQRKLGADTASALFVERIPKNEKLASLVDLVNRRLPVTAVIFDITECLFVRTQSEPIREVMYRAFLDTLGYSDDVDVAELEIDLEKRGQLDDFKRRYVAVYERTWEDGRRDRSFVFPEASAIFHEIDPKTYPSADSWQLGRKPVNLEVEQFVERCFELMKRRRPKDTLLFVIDEMGQYVSRSVDKMIDLQGVMHAFARIGRNNAKAGGKQAWVAVTAQEKLDEVVDALGQRKIELARLQARFATQVDLVPANISEVAAKRVLRKTPSAESLLGALYDAHSGRLRTLLAWQGTSRDSFITRDSFVRLYPFPPQFIELSLDVVTGIRLQPGAMRHIGGSNRTIIKQAQQALVHPDVALATKPVGHLVTLDMLFDLLRPSIPNERWRDVHDVELRIGPQAPLASKVAKTITLLWSWRSWLGAPPPIPC